MGTARDDVAVGRGTPLIVEEPVTRAERPATFWERLAPSGPLLPLLGLYILVVVIHRLPSGYGDESAYLTYAKNLTHGFFTQTSPSTIGAYLWHGPVLPILLVPLVALHFPLILTRILVSPVPLFLAIAVFHRMVRPYMSRRSALIAGYAVGVYLPFFPSIRAVYIEPLATLSLTLAVFFVIRSYRGGRLDHVWAGVALAVLSLGRVEFGYALLACLVISAGWLLIDRRSIMARRSLIACVVGLVLCLPWLAYTYGETGKPFYWSDSGGLSLYWMTAPGLGDWHMGAQSAADRSLFAGLAGLTPVAQDSRLTHAALQNIRHHPKHYLSNVVNNIDRLVFNSPYSRTAEKASSMLYAVPNALLLGVLALAALLAIRTRRRLPAEILPVAVLIALGFLIHVPVAAYARFVVPLAPAAAWLAIAVLAPTWPAPSASGPGAGERRRLPPARTERDWPHDSGDVHALTT